MKRYLWLICLFVCISVNAQSLFVGSYNIRYHNKEDSIKGNGWRQRCPVICDFVNFEAPDVFGSQEVLVGPLHDMLSRLDGYAYIGVGRNDGKESGEYSPIFYKISKFKLLKSNTIWLSEHPNVVGVKGWDAALPRICTWGYFKEIKTGFCFYFFNLHMDHIGIVARRESAKLVVSKIKEICKGAPVILTGDFNVNQKNEIYTIFTMSGVLKDSFVFAQHRFAENGTFNSFDPNLKSDNRIDHLFVSPNFNVNYYGVLTDCYWTSVPDAAFVQGKDAPKDVTLQKYQLRTPSDHYPIFAKIVCSKSVVKK